MYAGHFAIGLALQSRIPRQPAWPVLLGVGLLDMLNGLFIVLGWDQVSPNLAAGPYLYFDLRFIDWDHSLLAAGLWCGAWGLLCWRRSRALAAWGLVAALSHWVADWPVHNHDLALFPYAEQHVGAGLWARLGPWAWWLEGGLVLGLIGLAWQQARQHGADWRWPCALVAALWLGLNPWLSPMRWMAAWPEPWAHLGHGTLVGLGFLLPGLVLMALVKQAPSRPEQPTP